ncbi:Glycylpeptide N-tetradecanoyltransferase [Fasciola gigantica]|uniref:Glycylpeptide N-tetradecanoyltransferase n=1 Tax=Fasciola gigantica TaxID=46835 RepID=A0A504YEW3_FASGI|nr:Glycylpeptide N-tetradecanoyltransferase [Fasciola gigantica]
MSDDQKLEDSVASLVKQKKKSKKSKPLAVQDGDAPSTSAMDQVPLDDSKAVSNNLMKSGLSDSLLRRLTNVMLVSGSDSLNQISASTKEKKCKDDYRFWRTQPVPDLNEEISENGPIEPDKTLGEIRAEPYSLPEGFYWCEISLNDEKELQELYELLYENYVEDDDHLFRFDYSKSFLKWALQPPGWYPDWHVGLRVNKSKKLVGFIGAMPCHLQIYEKSKRLVEINFLCVHKKLRSKRMAPVLIREVTRRVHRRGLFQALYTSGALLPKPVVFLEQYKLHPVFSREDFEHYFVPQDDIVNSFVVQNDEGRITDFCSYYVLPSSVMKCKQHSTLRAAYSFYNAATETPWPALIQDMLIMAKQTVSSGHYFIPISPAVCTKYLRFRVLHPLHF